MTTPTLTLTNEKGAGILTLPVTVSETDPKAPSLVAYLIGIVGHIHNREKGLPV